MTKPYSPEARYGTRVALCAAIFLIGLFCSNVPRALAQGGAEYDSERKLAFQLLQSGKFTEAQQKFEKLAALNSSDGQVQFGLGFSLLATSKNISDAATRRQARLRARNALVR